MALKTAHTGYVMETGSITSPATGRELLARRRQGRILGNIRAKSARLESGVLLQTAFARRKPRNENDVFSKENAMNEKIFRPADFLLPAFRYDTVERCPCDQFTSDGVLAGDDCMVAICRPTPSYAEAAGLPSGCWLRRTGPHAEIPGRRAAQDTRSFRLHGAYAIGRRYAGTGGGARSGSLRFPGVSTPLRARRVRGEPPAAPGAGRASRAVGTAACDGAH